MESHAGHVPTLSEWQQVEQSSPHPPPFFFIVTAFQGDGKVLQSQGECEVSRINCMLRSITEVSSGASPRRRK